MTKRSRDITRSFAFVYDALYDNPLFIARRTDFLLSALGPDDGLLLDAGCGTGDQIEALRARGRAVVGLDVDLHMLTVASWKDLDTRLVCGDLRCLPFRAAFAGVLCLESPLAYLLDDEEFLTALRSIRRTLLPRGRVIIDTYDYVGMFWPEAMGLMRTQFGQVRVAERHEYDEHTRVWTMKQRFSLDYEGRARRFEVTHRLKIRTPDQYAAALEQTGFEIREMLAAYPGSPDNRVLVVASLR